MTTYSGRLGRKKKSELQEIAQELGLDSEGTKDELSQKITEFMAAGGAKGDARFSDLNIDITPYQRRNSRRSTSSPSKRASPTSEDTEEEEVDVKKTTTRRTSHKQSDKNKSVLEVDRKDGVDIIDHSAQVINWQVNILSAIEGLHLKKHARNVQSRLSHAHVIISLTMLLEFTLLVYTLLPFSYKFQIGPIHSIITGRDHIFQLALPNLLTLFYWNQFWYPVLLWATTTIVTPLVVAHFINFEPRKYNYSPLTYSVIKAAIIYATAYHGFLSSSKAKIAYKSGGLSTNTKGYDLIYALASPRLAIADAIIGSVFSVYEAIVRRH